MSDLFIGAKCLLLIIVVTIIFYEPHEPINDRADFDIISDRYLHEMARYKGLSSTKQDALRLELTHEGFKNISITAPKTAEWGDEVTLTITVEKTYTKLKGLSYMKETLNMIYRNSTIVSGLEDDE